MRHDVFAFFSCIQQSQICQQGHFEQLRNMTTMFITHNYAEYFICTRLCLDRIVFDFTFLIWHFMSSFHWSDSWTWLSLNSVFNLRGGTSPVQFPWPPMTTSPPHLPPPPHLAEFHHPHVGTGLAQCSLENWTADAAASLLKEVSWVDEL